LQNTSVQRHVQNKMYLFERWNLAKALFADVCVKRDNFTSENKSHGKVSLLLEVSCSDH